jgi:hypothetical protein
MILARNTKGQLCLIGNQSLSWYSDYQVIMVLKDLPIQLRRLKCSDTLDDIISQQSKFLNNAESEVKLRKELLNILYDLKKIK